MSIGSIFGTYIIAINGKPRNNKLITKITLNSQTPNSLVVFHAITPSDIPKDELKVLLKKGRAFLGRDIAEEEVAVALSHYNCYLDAKKRNLDFALILEDDMDIINSQKLNSLPSIVTDIETPIITTLFSPFWGIWREQDKMYTSIIPPAYAAAYIINRPALKIACENPPIGLADWPIWQEKVRFNLLKINLVEIYIMNSAIEDARNKAKKAHKRISSLLNFRYISEVSFSQKIANLYWRPFLWKLYKAQQIIKKLRKFQDNSSIYLNE